MQGTMCEERLNPDSGQLLQVLEDEPLLQLQSHIHEDVIHLATLNKREMLLQILHANAMLGIYETKLKAERPTAGPVQESISVGEESDSNLAESRLTPQQPIQVNPDVRLFLPDSQGMRLQQQFGRERGNISEPTREEAEEVNTWDVSPAAEWNYQSLATTPTVPAEHKIEILLEALKSLTDSLHENKKQLEQMRQMNSVLAAKLSEAQEKNADLKQENRSLRKKVENQNSTIYKFQKELNEKGRFRTSKVQVLDCYNCKKLFSSQEAAETSVCSYHPMTARILPNKMVAEVFPQQMVRQCYWPCCRKIDSKTPPPCRQGKHALKIAFLSAGTFRPY